MTDCQLTPDLLERLLAGRLTAPEAQALATHLATDCSGCDAALDRAGLDEETLLACLAGLEQPAPAQQSVERIWAAVQADQGRAFRPKLRLTPPRPAWLSWSMGLGGVALAAAAAVLVAVVVPPQERRSAITDGVKGVAAVPRATLRLAAASTDEEHAGRVFELRYGLERSAFVAVWHLRPNAAPALLFEGKVDQADAGRGQLRTSQGVVGYDFTDEPGDHLFVLAASETAIDAARASAMISPAWLTAAPEWIELSVVDPGVGFATLLKRVSEEGGE